MDERGKKSGGGLWTDIVSVGRVESDLQRREKSDLVRIEGEGGRKGCYTFPRNDQLEYLGY